MTETISAAATTDSGFACLAIVSRFFGKPLDPGQLRHEFAPPSGTDPYIPPDIRQQLDQPLAAAWQPLS
jgi:hypothetical protein